jgi:hypothetical protein
LTDDGELEEVIEEDPEPLARSQQRS